MSDLKTTQNEADIEQFLNQIEDIQRQADARRICKLLSEVSNEPPKMWGKSIVGFGKYHYKSERSRQEGDWPRIGFSPRKANLTIYIMPGFDDLKNELKKLGKHKTSVGCLYIKRLSDIDESALKQIIQKTLKRMSELYPE